MLTKEHALVQYRGGEIFPDRLSQKAHAHYLAYAEQMVEVYRSGLGKMRKELHTQIRKIFENEPDCPPQRIEAFCKLLDEGGEYDLKQGKKSALLRINLFRKAARFHPLVQTVDRLFDHSEVEVKRQIAEELKMSWDEIELNMFADVIEFQRLKEFTGYPTPVDLLSRYNVAQVQVALFQAKRLVIHIGADYKTLLTYAKLARLLHTIILRSDGRYTIVLDGPASVLRETKRYGVQMAKFFPALLTCRDWEMQGVIDSGRKGFCPILRVSDKDKLRSHLPAPNDFDSSFEKMFAEKWGEGPREGWSLIREGGILHRGQKVFFPDFLLKHEDGRKVYLEIVGFWTPEYLKEKCEVLNLFRNEKLLIAVAEASAQKMGVLPGNMLLFNTSLSLKDVLSYLERV